MARDPTVEMLIRRRARQRGLDESALLAVASTEGLYDPTGDVSGGRATSFGPFMLHEQGALPRQFWGRPNAALRWSLSQAGINYAVDRLAPIISGKRGRAAVSAAVTQFERPRADLVAGEIDKASSRLGQFGGGGMGLNTLQAPAGRRPRPAPPSQGLDFGSIISQTNEIVGLPSSGILRFAPGPMSRRAKQGGFGPAVQVEGATSSRGKKAATLVQHYLGTPYVWGGEKPGAFDCSGLLQYVWGKVGVKIPRVTYGQWKAGQPVGKKQLKPGDAVFFHSGAQGPEHVGMYIGGGEFIEAPHTGAVVRISKLAGRVDYLGARRYG